MLKEMKKQLGWLVFGVPKKQKKSTNTYYYAGRPYLTVQNGQIIYRQPLPKRKPRR